MARKTTGAVVEHVGRDGLTYMQLRFTAYGKRRFVALTPHSLRRTFASVLYALGEDPGVVMDEMGHTDPALALRVYRQTMRRDDGEKTALRALVEGGSPEVDAIADELRAAAEEARAGQPS